MKCTVVGKSLSSFVSRTTGEVVDNSKLFLTCPFPKTVYGDVENTGLRALEVKTPCEDIRELAIGEVVFVSFDDKGKYDSLERLSLPEPPKPDAAKKINKG